MSVFWTRSAVCDCVLSMSASSFAPPPPPATDVLATCMADEAADRLEDRLHARGTLLLFVSLHQDVRAAHDLRGRRRGRRGGDDALGRFGRWQRLLEGRLRRRH